jgi:hypothetical protein
MTPIEKSLFDRIKRLEKLILKIENKLCCPCPPPPTPDGIGVIPITSQDFNIDGNTYTNPLLVNKTYEIFYNDLNRYLYNEPGNKEWDYLPTGGFKILLPGFNANSYSYYLYLIPKA